MTEVLSQAQPERRFSRLTDEELTARARHIEKMSVLASEGSESKSKLQSDLSDIWDELQHRGIEEY